MLLLSYAKSCCRFIAAAKVGRVSCCAHLNPNLLRWCTPPGSEWNLGSRADYAGAESSYMAWSKCKHCHIAAQWEFLLPVLCVDQLFRAQPRWGEPARSGVWENPAVSLHAGISPVQPGPARLNLVYMMCIPPWFFSHCWEALIRKSQSLQSSFGSTEEYRNNEFPFKAFSCSFFSRWKMDMVRSIAPQTLPP